MELVRCPNCNGTGNMIDPEAKVNTTTAMDGSHYAMMSYCSRYSQIECDTCGGRGVVKRNMVYTYEIASDEELIQIATLSILSVEEVC